MLSAEMSAPDYMDPARMKLIHTIEEQQHDRMLDSEFGGVRPATLSYAELAITAGSMATAESTLVFDRGME